MHNVTVVIPTFQRPHDLDRAVRSVLAQSGAGDFSLLIVDNDPSASARGVSEQLVLDAPASIDVRYVHEPAPGVANARNTAVANVTSDLLVFLDDDQSVPPTWLARLLEFHAQYPAAVTFGPVKTKLPETAKTHRTYLEAFFARDPDLTSGYIDHYYGCGNALLDLKLIDVRQPLFDPAMNETGGEDDLLFQALSNAGERFGWCAEAPAFEHVPASRAQLSYTLRRAFGYGQGPITLALKASPTQFWKVAMWMAIGAGKAALNSALYAAHWTVRSPSRAIYLDRAVRGISKVFWWINFNFYGASALSQKSAS